MNTAGQWTLMISGSVGTLLVGLTVFFLAFFPSCAPEYCARYSPSVRQVMIVFQTAEEDDARTMARKRLLAQFRSSMIPVLEEVLRSSQSSEDDCWGAIALLGELGQDARPAIPAIHAALPSLRASLDRFGSDFLMVQLANMGVTSDWRAGLKDSDPRISRVFWNAAGRESSVAAFMLCWDALQNGVVTHRQVALEIMAEFHWPKLMEAPLDARIGSRLDAVIAHGPEDMREMAKSLKAWNTPEASAP
jgi:hypothetical protein